MRKEPGNRWGAIVMLGFSALFMGILAISGDPDLMFFSLIFVSAAILQVLLRAFAMLYAEESPPAKG